MTLAIRMQDLVDTGEVADYADLAHVLRARVTQIMNRLLLAPDIRKAPFFLPRADSRRPPREQRVKAVAAFPDWQNQRRISADLVGSRASGTGYPTRRSVD